jgi:hypothetical protein
VRHIARAPELSRVFVLILAAVVLTLEVRDGQMVDPRETIYVSLASSIGASGNPAETDAERGEAGGQSVHCRYVCVRAAVPRPRLDDLWPTTLLFIGLVVEPLDPVSRGNGRASAAAGAAATGGETLLRLCVCRR